MKEPGFVKEAREYGMSERDIDFLKSVYEHHKKINSDDNDCEQFCKTAIQEDIHPDDIAPAVALIEKHRHASRDDDKSFNINDLKKQLQKDSATK